MFYPPLMTISPQMYSSLSDVNVTEIFISLRCVKIIERKGADVMVTRDCLSNVETFRTDVPADKYDGCRTAAKDVQLGQYTFNTVKEIDTERNYYDNVTWCFCNFDHWCNSGDRIKVGFIFPLALILYLIA